MNTNPHSQNKSERISDNSSWEEMKEYSVNYQTEEEMYHKYRAGNTAQKIKKFGIGLVLRKEICSASPGINITSRYASRCKPAQRCVGRLASNFFYAMNNQHPMASLMFCADSPFSSYLKANAWRIQMTNIFKILTIGAVSVALQPFYRAYIHV